VAGLFSIRGEQRYDVVRKIFEGGMGVVYEAEQHGARGFVKRVAIKVIRQNLTSQHEFIENFVGEAKLVADLIHTNIVQTYHLGEHDGAYFIAMELINGVNLEQFTNRLAEKGRPLPVELAVFIASRVCRGLAYAHGKTDARGKPLGIVHRDVSFKNIMVAFEGDVKLTDFGVAKARGFLIDHEGEVIAGKAEYMSPEQADFQVTDKRSDLFSLGIVLAHLPDFRKLDKRINKPLDRILQRALARDLAQRYAGADEMLYDLEFYIYHSGYGPTNETLGKFVRELFELPPAAAARDAKGSTRLIEKTARIARKQTIPIN
jgi:eukaryotic-like serine/threonine-protein kinase